MAIPPGAWDLAPLIPVVGILVFGFLRALQSPLGRALADRARGSDLADPDLLADTRQEVENLQRRTLELEERLDFAERLLARGRAEVEAPESPTPV
jgi:hypothetical protein